MFQVLRHSTHNVLLFTSANGLWFVLLCPKWLQASNIASQSHRMDLVMSFVSLICIYTANGWISITIIY